MPQLASNDFGSKFDATLGNKLFTITSSRGANTALPWWRGDDETVERAAQLLKGTTRIDIFGVREGGVIDGKLSAPLEKELPALAAGSDVLLETVIRTLKLGHHLTQGTVDSNELWVEVTAKCGDKLIGHSGSMDEVGQVDPWSHFVNVFMLDRQGHRIARRNAQDIFVPLYNHQIPPGAGQTIHYSLQCARVGGSTDRDRSGAQYRKFDKGYIDFMNEARKEGDNEFRNSGPVGLTQQTTGRRHVHDRLVLAG